MSRLAVRSATRHWAHFAAVPGGIPPAYSFSETGDVASDIVEVTFTETVTSTNFANGVTIEVNTVPVAISSATLQGDGKTVHYEIPASDINDSITWEYDDTAGDIEDADGNDLASVGPLTVTNYIGSHLYFDEQEDSAHIATVGV